MSCAPEKLYRMRQLPLKERLQTVLGQLFASDAIIESLWATRTSPARVQGGYSIDLTGGQQLLIVTAPSTMVRLLRSEQLLVESEFVLLSWLRDTLTRNRLGVDKVGAAAEIRNGNMGQEKYSSDSTKSTLSPGAVLQGSEISPGARSVYSQTELLSMLPTVIASSTTDDLMMEDVLESPYIILHQKCERTISADNTYWSAFQDHAVDSGQIEFQAGSMVRQLSRITAPTGEFGPVISVLAPGTSDRDSSASRTWRPMAVSDNSSWSAAFRYMLEAVLRDAEDMAIHIPYTAIRSQLRRHYQCLDAVTTPRLVLIDAAEPSNILLRARDTLPEGADGRFEGPGQQTAVAGLADWSNALFGDPLFTKAFSKGPSDSFLRGFYGDPEGDDARIKVEAEGQRQQQDASHLRILLYSCYHFVMSIVKAYYRPGPGSTEREMDARRRLSKALAVLAGAAAHVGDDVIDLRCQFRHGRLTVDPSTFDPCSSGVDWSTGPVYIPG